MARSGPHSHETDDVLDHIKEADTDSVFFTEDWAATQEALSEVKSGDITLGVVTAMLAAGVMPDAGYLNRAMRRAKFLVTHPNPVTAQAQLGISRFVALHLEYRALLKTSTIGIPRLETYLYPYTEWAGGLEEMHINALAHCIKTGGFPLNYIAKMPDGLYFEDRWFDDMRIAVAIKALSSEYIRGLLTLPSPTLHELDRMVS